MKEYIIVGDTKKFKNCLVYTCGKSRERAEEILHRMLTNPDERYRDILKTHTNLRVEEVPESEQWWNDPFLAN